MTTFDIPPPQPPQKPSKKEQVQLVDYPETPNIFDDTAAEVMALAKQFKNARDKEKETKDRNTNAAYWFAVYFQDEDQKKEFFNKIGVTPDISAGQYIDGITFAKLIGIDIVKKEVKKPGKFREFKL